VAAVRLKNVLLLFLFPVLFACGSVEGNSTHPWTRDLPENPEDGSHLDFYKSGAGPFYEGWYNKVSDPETGESFFFIYTVVNPGPNMPEPKMAFIYCGRQKTLQTVYQEFPVEDYSAAPGYRDVRIGPDSRATAPRFAGTAMEGNKSCSWDFDVDNVVPWHETMGWMTGHTDRKTNWTVGTMRGDASGYVEFEGKRFTMKNARAYCDHNWGTVFPEQWVWLQAASFDNHDTAIALSGGLVQFAGKPLEAMMIGLLTPGKDMVTFRTQDLDDITWDASKGKWSISASRSTARLSVQASCEPRSMFHLLVPADQGMIPRAWEALEGFVDVLFETRGSAGDEWKEEFRGTSNLAGVEIGE